MKIYSSRDFYLSAFLMAGDILLYNHYRNGPITIFEFESTDKLRELVDSYYSDQAIVNPLRFGSSIRSLKSILHNYSKGANTYEVITNETPTSKGKN